MIYLNYAGLCPTNDDVAREVDATLAEFKPLLFSDPGVQWFRQKLEECRQKIAKVLNLADATSLAFVPNASTANKFVLASMDWNPGDGIITSGHENPSIMHELRIREYRGTCLHIVREPSEREFISHLTQLTVTHQIKAIVLSHVSHIDGRIYPIQAIAQLARSKNILFAVDGTQAVGHIPVDVDRLGCDAYFFSGHKWCCGPVGIGALAVSEHYGRVNPTFDSECRREERTKAQGFEIGTLNIGLIAGLAKACALRERDGTDTSKLQRLRDVAKGVFTRRKDLHLMEWGESQAPGILAFECMNAIDSDAVVNTLYAKWGIAVKHFQGYRELKRPTIRLSWSAATKEADLLFALDKIGECLTNSTKGKP